MTPNDPRPTFYLIRDTASAEDGNRYATLATEPEAPTTSGGVASADRIPPSRARRLAEAAEASNWPSASPFPRKGYHLTVTDDALHALGMDCDDDFCEQCNPNAEADRLAIIAMQEAECPACGAEGARGTKHDCEAS
jgi:hypothetical protein